ncbi:MAG: hypothetical protein EAY75_15935 [Bacteroidetes bacterium]|nr:MAG: hypothetical protein EAY75_15935 [Bacteroidota bacterium]
MNGLKRPQKCLATGLAYQRPKGWRCPCQNLVATARRVGIGLTMHCCLGQAGWQRYPRAPVFLPGVQAYSPYQGPLGYAAPSAQDFWLSYYILIVMLAANNHVFFWADAGIGAY